MSESIQRSHIVTCSCCCRLIKNLPQIFRTFPLRLFKLFDIKSTPHLIHGETVRLCVSILEVCCQWGVKDVSYNSLCWKWEMAAWSWWVGCVKCSRKKCLSLRVCLFDVITCVCLPASLFCTAAWVTVERKRSWNSSSKRLTLPPIPTASLLLCKWRQVWLQLLRLLHHSHLHWFWFFFKCNIKMSILNQMDCTQTLFLLQTPHGCL